MKELDRKIKNSFDIINFRAYVYFYYFPDCINENEISKKAFILSKEGALKYISKIYALQSIEEIESALNKDCLAEFNNFFESVEAYKKDADFLMKTASYTLLKKP